MFAIESSFFANGFYEIAALLSVAMVAGAIALWLRQPLIMAFIAVGILVGPAGFDWIGSNDPSSLFAKLGIAMLLFVVGLKLDPQEIRAVGPVAIVTGLSQIALTGLIGFGIAVLLGLKLITALYVATALTFSSTIIIVKLLSDKQEADALHGRIALGVLIIQDIAVVLVMIGLTAFGDKFAQTHIAHALLMVLAKGTAFLIVTAILTRFGLPQLLNLLAQSTELLILFAIAWAVSLGSVAEALGFSKEVGAFLAGVTLATTPYRATIGSRLASLRDFLLVFFFIDLGVHINIHYLGDQVGAAILFSLFVLLGKPLMVMVLMGMMGYRKYTSTMTGLSLSQISEFSLILGALGLSLGHIDDEAMGLITLIGLITIGLSTYMIMYSHVIYEKLAPWLSIFERPVPHPEEALGDSDTEACPVAVDVIVFGLGRYGGSVVKDLRRYGFEVLGVDFDPELITARRKEGLWTLYGDAADPEFAATLPLEQTQWIISTIPNRDASLTMLHTLRKRGFNGKIALTSHSMAERDVLEEAGADLVLLPFNDAAREVARTISTLIDLKQMEIPPEIPSSPLDLKSAA